MLYYYIKLAIRSIFKRKGFSFLNIFGLSIGLASCMMITQYVSFNRSYDRHSKLSEDVYRVQYSRWSDVGEKVSFASATPVIGPAIRETFPEVTSMGRAYKVEGVFFYEGRSFDENRVFYGEAPLFEMLGYDILKGDIKNNFDFPAKIALSESVARKYFMDADPIGKVVYWNKKTPLEVVAVYSDPLPNMHFKSDIFISLQTWVQQSPEVFTSGWLYSGFYTYISLKEGSDPLKIEDGIAGYVKEYYGEALSEGGIDMGFKLQPMTGIHLGSHLMHEIEPNGDKASVDFLEIIAWFILIIAWANFFNLSTIAAIQRLKELGIREVSGASNGRLFSQLIIESAVINTLAILLALAIYEISSLFFFPFAALPEGLSLWQQGWFYVMIAVALVVGTFSAGIYSVVRISSSNLLGILKGSVGGKSRGATTKKMLVGFQFIISILLLVATVGVYKQYKFISGHDLGFQLDGMMVVKAPLVTDSIYASRAVAFKNHFKGQSGINGLCFSSVIPGLPNMYNRGGVYRYGENYTSGKNYRVTEVDKDFFDVFGIKIIAGEGFTGNPEKDAGLLLVNEYAVWWMGRKSAEEAVGSKLVFENEVKTISGVVRDFYQLTPKEALEPQIFKLPQRNKGFYTFNIGTTSPERALPLIKDAYEKWFPDNPVEAFFLKDYYNEQFKQEQRFGTVFGLFSILALLITLMGLMGLSAWHIEQKRKEIGIRKVLGASDASIFRMLFSAYLILWVIASCVALPVGGWFLKRWLEGFALRIELNAIIFIVPLAIVLFVAIITVWWQSRKAIALHPVDAIRYE